LNLEQVGEFAGDVTLLIEAQEDGVMGPQLTDKSELPVWDYSHIMHIIHGVVSAYKTGQDA
jgi:hypothetical protein